MTSYIRPAPLFYQLEWQPDSPADSFITEHLSLTGDEAKHAMNARRLRQGDAIEVSNGQGIRGTGIVENVSARPAELNLRIESIELHPLRDIELVLATALPKGDRQATLLDMATQLGMRRFIPLECTFSSVQFQSKMLARWQRVLLSACKQSRRHYLPEIDQDTGLDGLLNNVFSDTLLLFGDQHGEPITSRPASSMRGIHHIIAIVGPEGGFSKAETRLLRDHPQTMAISAGPHILRTEAAAIALLTLANQLIN